MCACVWGKTVAVVASVVTSPLAVHMHVCLRVCLPVRQCVCVCALFDVESEHCSRYDRAAAVPFRNGIPYWVRHEVVVDAASEVGAKEVLLYEQRKKVDVRRRSEI